MSYLTYSFTVKKAHCTHTKMIKSNESGNNNIDNIKKIRMVETHIAVRMVGSLEKTEPKYF